VERTLRDRSETDKISKAAKTNCGLPEEAMKHSVLYRLKHFKPEIKSPGNSREDMEQTTVTIYTGKGAPELEKTASAVIQRMPGDASYIISAGHDVYLDTIGDHVIRENNVCVGKPKTQIHHKRTVPLGDEGGITTSGDDDNSETWVSIPPMPNRLMFVAQRKSGQNSDVISDTDTKKSKQGTYKEKTVASWHLEAKDPCDDVFKGLLETIAYAEAYADPDIRSFAETVTVYETLITDRFEKIFSGKPRPRNPGDEDSDTPSHEMEVSHLCVIKDLDAIEEQYKLACIPPVVFEAMLEHEKEHVKQCFQDSEKFNTDANTKEGVMVKGQVEVSAYLVGADVYYGWLQLYCADKNLDLSGAESRINKVKGMKAGWGD
jgi:hypothetical protein